MVIPYHIIQRNEVMIKLKEKLERKTNELNTVKSDYESKTSDLENQLANTKLEHKNREEELIKKYEENGCCFCGRHGYECTPSTQLESDRILWGLICSAYGPDERPLGFQKLGEVIIPKPLREFID